MISPHFPVSDEKLHFVFEATGYTCCVYTYERKTLARLLAHLQSGAQFVLLQRFVGFVL